MPQPVTASDVARAVLDLELADTPVCVHSSLRSFGYIEGGAAAVVAGFAGAGVTLAVPTYSWNVFSVTPPPPNMRPRRNGTNYDRLTVHDTRRTFSVDDNDIDPNMGAVGREVLHRPDRARGDHPLCSFSAVGPRARALMATQTPDDPLAPLAAIASLDGWVALLGVGLTSMTLLHLAEQDAGRALFYRWARVAGRGIVPVRVGGCSMGFEELRPVLDPLEREVRVGPSRWRVFRAADVLAAATEAIRRTPAITRCPDAFCMRCEDAIAGGPIAPLRLR